jgi:hypothetical protein
MSNFHDTAWAESTMRTARSQSAGKPLENNTRLYANEDGSYRIRLHYTDIVTINTDGTYTLRANGYHTVTTAQRMRGYSPVKLISDRGEWFVQIEPNPKDPQPERFYRTVPKPFEAIDPGPEPVKDADGWNYGEIRRDWPCVAGTDAVTLHDNEEIEIYRLDMREGDELVEVVRESSFGNDEYDTVKVRRTWRSGVYYGEIGSGWGTDDGWREFVNLSPHDYSYRDTRTVDGVEYKYEQCPHCEAFAKLHEAWRLRYEGPRWGVRFDGQRDYKTYAEMMERFGTMEAWQEAYIEDFRARKVYIKEAREWEERNRVPFYDGITVDSEGYAPRIRKDGPSPAKLRRHKAEVKRVKHAIDKYCDGFIAALKAKMPMPSNGDCWYCAMKTDEGVPLGDAAQTLHPDGSLTTEVNTDHLWSHIEESYYVPSLICNALLERGYKPVGVYMLLDMKQDEQTMGGRDRYDGPKRDLRKYLNKRLIPQAPTE